MTTAAAHPAPDPEAMLRLADAFSRQADGVRFSGNFPYVTGQQLDIAAAALRAAAQEQDRLSKIETAANGVARYWGGGGPGMRYTSGAWTPDFAEAMTVLHAALLAAPPDQEPTL